MHICNPSTLEVKDQELMLILRNIGFKASLSTWNPTKRESLGKKEGWALIGNNNHLLWLMFMVHVEFRGSCLAGGSVELFA